MPSVVNLRLHEPMGPRRTSARARQRGRPSRLCPRIDPREGRRADARATAEGLNQLPGTAIGDKQQTPQQLRFVSGCSIRVADGNSRSLPYGPTRGGPWMWRLEAIQASSHDAVDGVAPTVRNSHQTNPRLPSRAELIMLGVIGTPRRNVLGAIASEKNDCNFPRRRQPRRIPKKCQPLLPRIHRDEQTKKTGDYYAKRYRYAATQRETVSA